MQSLQQANNKPIRSFAFSFQFFSAISNNQPSVIKPSKKGNIVLLTNGLSCKGSDKLTGFTVDLVQ